MLFFLSNLKIIVINLLGLKNNAKTFLCPKGHISRKSKRGPRPTVLEKEAAPRAGSGF